jgi:transcriptional regulator with XRE-family HTH domain
MKSKEKLSENQQNQLAKIGERLKELRIQKGYTSYETFAFDHGLNRANYGRYEKGANLRVATLIKILECHNLSLEEFLKPAQG